MPSRGCAVITAFIVLALIYSIVPGLRSRWSHYAVQFYDPSPTNSTSNGTTKNDLLVVYAYHESEAALESARFFIKHGLHAYADFIFMVNGISQLEREIPKSIPNLEVRLRDNECFDLGSYGQMLGEDDRALVKKYKKFILLNSSIRGPFLPTWSKDCWSDVYMDMVTDKVKLGGMTFNCPGQHVNSMIYSTDQTGLNIMLDDCFQSCFKKMSEAVHCEQRTTKNMILKGYQFDVLMTGFHGEFEDRNDYFDTCETNHFVQDVNVNGGYFGFNVHPYETLFVKSNRNIEPNMIKKLEEWHDTMNYSSWDVCKRSKKADQRL